MSHQVVGELSQKIPAYYRCTTHLEESPCVIQYEDKGGSHNGQITIELSSGGGDNMYHYKSSVTTAMANMASMSTTAQTSESIKTKDLESVRARDYQDHRTFMWYLILQKVHPSKTQVALRFNKKAQRDTWEAGIKCLISNQKKHVSSKTETVQVAAKSKQLQWITEVIVLHTTTPEELVRLRLRQGDADDSEALTLAAGGSLVASIDDCHSLAMEFCRMNSCHDEDATSLGRLIWSVAQRNRMEQKTVDLINKIRDFHVTDMIQKETANKFSPRAFKSAPYSIGRTAHQSAKVALLELKGEMVPQLGRQGPEAIMLAQVLKRNTDKARLINDSLIRAYYNEQKELVAKLKADSKTFYSQTTDESSPKREQFKSVSLAPMKIDWQEAKQSGLQPQASSRPSLQPPRFGSMSQPPGPELPRETTFGAADGGVRPASEDKSREVPSREDTFGNRGAPGDKEKHKKELFFSHRKYRK